MLVTVSLTPKTGNNPTAASTEPVLSKHISNELLKAKPRAKTQKWKHRAELERKDGKNMLGKLIFINSVKAYEM